MEHETIPSPKKQALYAAWSIPGTGLLIVLIVIIANLQKGDPSQELKAAIAEEREKTLNVLQSKARRDAALVEWTDSEEKIARIPIQSAIDIVLKKIEDSGNISFHGAAAPLIGTKLSTGPFTLVDIPPLAQDESRDAELIEWSQDSEIISKGEAQYGTYCLQCHGGPDMPGEGPALLFDGEWYYASTPSQMEQLLWKGIIQKGMPPWEGILSAEVTGQIVAYILRNQAK